MGMGAHRVWDFARFFRYPETLKLNKNREFEQKTGG
jgi:hypothetical protein